MCINTTCVVYVLYTSRGMVVCNREQKRIHIVSLEMLRARAGWRHAFMIFAFIYAPEILSLLIVAFIYAPEKVVR